MAVGDQQDSWVAGGRLEVEQLREQRHDSLFDVDPYDVLARDSESGFKTAYEREEASTINPQPLPDQPRVDEKAATREVAVNETPSASATTAVPPATTAAAIHVVRKTEGGTREREANMSSKSTREPNIVAVLSAQHTSTFKLFEQLRDPDFHLRPGEEDHGQGAPHHYRLAHEIIGVLMAHSEGVQRLLEVITENAADGGKLSDGSARQDGDMLAVARRLNTLEVADPGFITTVDALQRAFEHHVQREEAELFPLLRNTLSPKNSRLLAAGFRGPSAIRSALATRARH